MYVMPLALIEPEQFHNQKEYIGTHGTDWCNLDASWYFALPLKRGCGTSFFMGNQGTCLLVVSN